jgi:hypothetical protein
MNKQYIKLNSLGLALLAIIGFFSTYAVAAPPSNDNFSGAIVAFDGFTQTLDRTEATTDDDDTAFRGSCTQDGDPFGYATDASVWYEYTPDSDGTVIVDTNGSGYQTGVLVDTGTQGNFQTENCGDNAVAFFALKGIKYYVLVIDTQFNNDGVNGGILNVTFTKASSPTLDDFTINKFGSVNTKTGAATISGSYTCSHFNFIDFWASASQKVGRVATIQGTGFFFGQCDGLPHPWSAVILPTSGKFAGGKSISVVTHFGCGLFNCSSGISSERIVQLRRGK